MSILDNGTTKGLREIFGYYDKFDVFLACPYEIEENGQTKFELYDRIYDVVYNFGKRPYNI